MTRSGCTCKMEAGLEPEPEPEAGNSTASRRGSLAERAMRLFRQRNWRLGSNPRDI